MVHTYIVYSNHDDIHTILISSVSQDIDMVIDLLSAYIIYTDLYKYKYTCPANHTVSQILSILGHINCTPVRCVDYVHMY